MAGLLNWYSSIVIISVGMIQPAGKTDTLLDEDPSVVQCVYLSLAAAKQCGAVRAEYCLNVTLSRFLSVSTSWICSVLGYDFCEGGDHSFTYIHTIMIFI